MNTDWERHLYYNNSESLNLKALKQYRPFLKKNKKTTTSYYYFALMIYT
jgi:hypothetical protein